MASQLPWVPSTVSPSTIIGGVTIEELLIKYMSCTYCNNWIIAVLVSDLNFDNTTSTFTVFMLPNEYSQGITDIPNAVNTQYPGVQEYYLLQILQFGSNSDVIESWYYTQYGQQPPSITHVIKTHMSTDTLVFIIVVAVILLLLIGYYFFRKGSKPISLNLNKTIEAFTKML